MKLFIRLLSKELAARLHQRTFLVYALVTVLTICGSFMLLQQQYRIKRQNYNQLTADFRKTALEYNRYAHLAFRGAYFAFPPEVLQAFSQGTGTLYSRFSHIALNTWDQNRFPLLRTDKLINPLDSFLPSVDLSLIVIFFLSLMVLVFSHDTVSGEREQGTLRLMLSYSVPRAQVILAKLCGGYFIVALPVVFSLITVLLLIQLSGTFVLGGGMTAAFGFIALFVLLYLLVLYLLGVFVSVLCRRSSTAIAVLILVWLVFIVVVHNLGIMATQQRTGTGSVFQVIFKQQERGEKIWDEVKKYGHKKFNTKDTDEWTTEQWQEIIPYELDIIEKSIGETVGEYINNLENEYRLLAVLSYVSPSLIFMSSVSDLAGTGLKGHIRVLRDIISYHEYYKNLVKTRAHDQYVKEKKTYWTKLDKGLFKQFKELTARTVEPAERIKSVLWRLFSLACFGVIFFLLAFVSFLRTEVS